MLITLHRVLSSSYRPRRPQYAHITIPQYCGDGTYQSACPYGISPTGSAAIGDCTALVCNTGNTGKSTTWDGFKVLWSGDQGSTHVDYAQFNNKCIDITGAGTIDVTSRLEWYENGMTGKIYSTDQSVLRRYGGAAAKSGDGQKNLFRMCTTGTFEINGTVPLRSSLPPAHPFQNLRLSRFI